MSPLGVTLFTAAFAAVCILFGDYYHKFNVSYETMLIITIIAGVALTVNIIFEQFIRKDKTE